LKRARIEDLFTIEELKAYMIFFPGSGQLVRRDKHRGKRIEFGDKENMPIMFVLMSNTYLTRRHGHSIMRNGHVVAYSSRTEIMKTFELIT